MIIDPFLQRSRGFRRGLLLGLLLGWHGSAAPAQEPISVTIPVVSEAEALPVESMATREPVRRVPNLLGDFFGRTVSSDRIQDWGAQVQLNVSLGNSSR